MSKGATCEGTQDAASVCTVVSLDAGPRRPTAVVRSGGVLAIRHWRVSAELGGHWCDVLIETSEVRRVLEGVVQ